MEADFSPSRNSIRRYIADWKPEPSPRALRYELNCAGVSWPSGFQEAFSASSSRTERLSAAIATGTSSWRRAFAAVSHSCTTTVNHSSMTWVVTRKTISPGSSERVCWRWVRTSALT
ncbi:hypothetical protein SGLAM104S_08837 [Streptomyces glaucescens]